MRSAVRSAAWREVKVKPPPPTEWAFWECRDCLQHHQTVGRWGGWPDPPVCSECGREMQRCRRVDGQSEPEAWDALCDETLPTAGPARTGTAGTAVGSPSRRPARSYLPEHTECLHCEELGVLRTVREKRERLARIERAAWRVVVARRVVVVSLLTMMASLLAFGWLLPTLFGFSVIAATVLDAVAMLWASRAYFGVPDQDWLTLAEDQWT